MWLGRIVAEDWPSVGRAIWELDGCSSVFDDDTEVLGHERAVRESRLWLRPSTQ